MNGDNLFKKVSAYPFAVVKYSEIFNKTQNVQETDFGSAKTNEGHPTIKIDGKKATKTFEKFGKSR